MVVRGIYDVAGLRADADFMIWTHAETVEALQATYSDFRRTTKLGRAGTPVWSNMPVTVPRSSTRATFRRSWPGRTRGLHLRVSVRPVLEWYLLPDEERRRMLAEHGKAARGYKDVRANTVTSFALGDYEWLLAFEAPNCTGSSTIRDLRATERASTSAKRCRSSPDHASGSNNGRKAALGTRT